MRTQCKHCGTVFEAGTEPWLKQQEHCTKHDVVFPSGTECTSCVAEREDAASRADEAERNANRSDEKEQDTGGEHEMANSSGDSSVSVREKGRGRRH